MLDWLAIWGVTQAAGFVFKPILEDLAKDAAKDYAKDFFKDCLKKVIKLPEKDEQKEAYGKALKEFLQFFQQELDDADYQEIQIKQYLEPLKKFIEKPEVAAILGSAFEADCLSLDTHFLARNWELLNLPFLPDEFSWERVSKRYLKKVKAIIQESEKLRPIFAVQIQSQMAENVQELVGIPTDFNLEKYAEGLQETYGNLRLDSLDIDAPSYNNLKLWKIFVPQNIKECQEILPLELPKENQQQFSKEFYPDLLRYTKEELEQYHKYYINQQSRLIWEIIGDPTAEFSKSPIQHTVILGDPGSGKSSLLQYLALTWAKRPIKELSLYPLPLLIELRLYAADKQVGNCKDLLSFIHTGNVPCQLDQKQLYEKLKAGSVIALFDGIDEIFDLALRNGIVQDIHRFSNDYPHVQIITTSRRLGYKGERLRNAGFRHFMLQDLEIDQIKEFIEHWHELTFLDQSDKVRKKKRLIQAIEDSKAIRELAGNPLLLTMMAILNRNQELPKDRSKLYEKASEILLYKWDIDGKVELKNPTLKDWKVEISLSDKQKMLRKVAYFMQSNKKDTSGNLISKSDLENILTESLREIIERGEPRMIARVMIEELQTRNFILCFLGADSYGFVHRTFLEYFCAWEFVWQFKETQMLTIEQLINDVFGAHWQDESWHEVLRLICGMIEPKFVAEIINFLLEQKVDLSKFLDEDDRITKEGLGNLILAANCFAEVRNRNLIATTSAQLLKVLKDEIKHESQPSFHGELIQTLMSLIVTSWKEDPDTLPWLKDRALQDENESVRHVAVTEIAQGWKEDPDTLPFLKDRALQGNGRAVRGAVVRMIAQGWEKDPDTLLFLKNRALQDEHWLVRRTAVNAITQGWKEDPDTLIWLKDRALQNEDNDVRQVAVTEIAQGWKEDPDTLLFLKNRALQDENGNVRYAAVNAIIQNWKENPELFESLANIVLNDPFKREYDLQYNPRQTALEALLENFGDNPKTLEILNQVALNDSDEELREFAVEKLRERETG